MPLDSDLARQLDVFNLTHKLQEVAHQTMLSYLFIEPPRAAVEAAQRSLDWAKLTRKPVQSVADYEFAISDMIDRDLIWVIDANKQSLIADYLDADPALGPTDGIPDLDTLQITIRFANLLDDLWANLDCERPGVIWSRDCQSDHLHLIYSSTRKQCLEFLREELSADDDDAVHIEHVSGPKPCGPWRCNWWHNYKSGYVLEVHYL